MPGCWLGRPVRRRAMLADRSTAGRVSRRQVVPVRRPARAVAGPVAPVRPAVGPVGAGSVAVRSAGAGSAPARAPVGPVRRAEALRAGPRAPPSWPNRSSEPGAPPGAPAGSVDRSGREPELVSSPERQACSPVGVVGPPPLVRGQVSESPPEPSRWVGHRSDSPIRPAGKPTTERPGVHWLMRMAAGLLVERPAPERRPVVPGCGRWPSRSAGRPTAARPDVRRPMAARWPEPVWGPLGSAGPGGPASAAGREPAG
jgi:hypothetical protein